LEDGFVKQKMDHPLPFYFFSRKDFPMPHTPYIDLTQYSCTKYKKKKAEGPPVVMPFRLGLCPKEVFARVVSIDMAFDTVLFGLFHIRLTGKGLSMDHEKEAPHQKDSQ
jgi:hypothetical protein